MPAFGVRFSAPIIRVSSLSSYNYRPSLPLPSISTLLGALIARLNELEPLGKIVSVGDLLKENTSYKARLERLDGKLYLGIAPVPGTLITVSPLLRKISLILKEEKKEKKKEKNEEEEKSNAVTIEYAFIPYFDVIAYVEDEALFELIKQAMPMITRLGDTESLVSPIARGEAKEIEAEGAHGVLPAELAEDPFVVKMPGSLVVTTKGEFNILLSFSLEQPKRFLFKPRMMRIVRDERVKTFRFLDNTIAAVRIDAPKDKGKRKGSKKRRR